MFVPVLKLNDDIFLYTCKISLLGSLDVISGDILDRRDGKDFDYFKISFRCTKLIKWQRLRLRVRLASKSRAKTANIVNTGVFCILFSSLVPLQFSIYYVHLPLKANFKPVLFNLILLNCVCFYASL